MSIRIQDTMTENKKKELRRMQLFSNASFMVENLAMILLFYFSPFSNTWYSLPVTVCVCAFAVLGAVIRVTHFRFLTKESNNDSVEEQL